MNNFYVEYFSPVTRGGGIVETTKKGVSREQAESIAKESNNQFKPLQYTVKEFAVKA